MSLRWPKADPQIPSPSCPNMGVRKVVVAIPPDAERFMAKRMDAATKSLDGYHAVHCASRHRRGTSSSCVAHKHVVRSSAMIYRWLILRPLN
jgi:hypothetical protein